MTRQGMRLAELVAVLSLGTDLGLGQPMEHVLRQALIALRLGDAVGLETEERRVLYYTALLAYAGCHVDAHEQARWFGDDLALKHDERFVDLDGPLAEAAFLVGHLGAGRPPLERLRLGLAFLGGAGRRAVEDMFANHSMATNGLAQALGLGEPVVDSVDKTFERWDGRGLYGLRGDEIPLTARLTALADVVEVYHRHGGAEHAIAAARERSGSQFDPDLVHLLAEHPSVLDELDGGRVWEEVIRAEPDPCAHLPATSLDAALEAVADFTDLKCPWLAGHSRRVAQLAGTAAAGLGLPPEEVERVRRAGLVHDIGRLGVANTVWDKRGPLTLSDWERIRLHPYLSERMLTASPRLAAVGELAGRHHERLDGSGYPRGLTGDSLSPGARVLAAADVYAAATEPRPHRDALTPDAAAAVLATETRAGRLDGPATDAVLAAAGHQVARRRQGPAGLTAREVEVLRLLARGLTAGEIAQELVISRKTARNHIEHIYAKAGVANRAQASLFAVRHGLTAP